MRDRTNRRKNTKEMKIRSPHMLAFYMLCALECHFFTFCLVSRYISLTSYHIWIAETADQPFVQVLAAAVYLSF